jgi:hypothetical protein
VVQELQDSGLFFLLIKPWMNVIFTPPALLFPQFLPRTPPISVVSRTLHLGFVFFSLSCAVFRNNTGQHTGTTMSKTLSTFTTLQQYHRVDY